MSEQIAIMYFGKRWVPVAVADYFIAFTVIAALLVGIAFLWVWREKRASMKARSRKMRQTKRAKRERRKKRR